MGSLTKQEASHALEEVSYSGLRLYSLLPSFAIFYSDNYKEKVNGPFDKCTTDILRLRTHYGEIWKRCFPSQNASNVFRPHYTSERLLYVIAWARGQWRINFTSIFKVFTKIQVKLILNCTRALAITCLSHTGQNFVQRTTFKVLPSRKQVCRLSLKNRL